MNAKLRLAEDISRFIAMFPGIAEYAADVGQVGSLEQAASEAEARLAKANQQLQALTDQTAVIKSQHGDLAAGIRAKAEADAGEIAARADTLLKDAGQSAAQIIA